jgi:hypothetical protein
MTNLQSRIALLEEQGNDAELLALLSCDPEARRRYRQLSDDLRETASRLRQMTLTAVAA